MRRSTSAIVSKVVAPLSDSIRRNLGEGWSTKRYYIEYRLLSNHLAHGVVALARLGASDNLIEEFAAKYAEKLEPASSAPDYHDAHGKITSFDPSLLGQRKNYYELLSFYEGEINKNGSDVTISTFLPLLHQGLAGAAFHGAIHLGYGYAAQVDEIIAEGLAYLHFCYVPLYTENSNSTSSYSENQIEKTNRSESSTFEDYAATFTSMLETLQTDADLYRQVEEGKTMFKDTGLSTFQRAIMALSHNDNGASLYKYTDPLPNCGDTMWIVDLMLQLYVRTCTENSSDFFLLHGVTSSWALAQVSHLLQLSQRSELHRSLENALFAAYVVQGCPPIENPLLSLQSKKLSWSWDDIVSNTLQNVQNDEHVFKLVEIARERASSNEAHVSDEICREAAIRVGKLEFRFAGI
uniref:Uncharacterized protein n=1 Tax=Aplanochytrium stocchinoi TaxID=215587 RepID=A0A7S3PQK6_9STRA|mmetsp:Transcript_5901/g.7709  ORF Transcript_5901/g.7709 Transcript_5901/m.7709 type:complete len:408 (+) Transcript_5901:150-1373(+)